VVARKRESNRRSFLFSRGFVSAECVTYRLGRLEGQQAAPSLYVAGHLSGRLEVADRES
jgi:hypothetical protein